MSSLAPIAVFAYRRAEHLRRTLESLRRCVGYADSPLHVFADGARGDADAGDVAAARSVASGLLGTRAEYHLSPRNQGLSRSIIAGVADVLERHDRVIVIEDDMELSPGLLRYLNAALDRYADEPRVWQVSGHMFDVREFAGRERAMFLPFTTSWGWATWRRAWQHLDANATDWQSLARDPALVHRFNLDGACDYTTMLENQMRGIGDSWAVRWYWSVFRARALVLFPPVSMVRNTGMDGSGTHGRGLLRGLRGTAPALHPGPIELPADVAVDGADFDAVRRAIWRHNGGWSGRAVDRLRRWRTSRSRSAGRPAQ